jgi:hypothetical protein
MVPTLSLPASGLTICIFARFDFTSFLLILMLFNGDVSTVEVT